MAEHIHACTRTAPPREPVDGRRFSAVAMATSPPSDGEEKLYDFLEGQSRVEALPRPARSHHPCCPSPHSSVLLLFLFFLFLFPPPCYLFRDAFISPPERPRWLGAEYPKGEAAAEDEDEAAAHLHQSSPPVVFVSDASSVSGSSWQVTDTTAS